MDDKYKKVIIQNIPSLMYITNLQDVQDQLITLGVYKRHLMDSLLATEIAVKEQKAQKLFLDLQTRGPKTFEFLIEALIVTGNLSIACKLLDDASKELDKDKSAEISLSSQSPENKSSPVILHRYIYSPPEIDEIDSSSNSSFNLAGLPPLKKFKFKASESLISEEGTEESSFTSSNASNSENEAPSSPSPAAELTSPSCTVKLCSSDNPTPHIDVISSRALYNGSKDLSDVYSMESHPRGLALIVNNKEFLGDPAAKRRGAEYDSVNLKELFGKMDFEVTLAENVTKQGLLGKIDGVLENFIREFDAVKVDCCIVSLNSHGFNRDLIRSSDPPRGDEAETAVDLILDIIRRFNNKNFPAFQGKPKIFLVNACRGGQYNRSVRKSTNAQQKFTRIQSDGEIFLPLEDELGSEYSDIFVLRSTIPEYISMRDLDRGAWFVDCICNAFAKFSHELHFSELQRQVSGFMEKMHDANFGKQSCHYEEYGRTKRLYFNPGI